VWEVLAVWQAAGVREATDWLTEAQRRAALDHRALYPEEIDRRLAVEEGWTPARVRGELPVASFGPGLSQPGAESRRASRRHVGRASYSRIGRSRARAAVSVSAVPEPFVDLTPPSSGTAG
jgi:hypothetical protein